MKDFNRQQGREENGRGIRKREIRPLRVENVVLSRETFRTPGLVERSYKRI